MSGLWKRTALALTLATLALPAQANDYPSKSITIMPLLAAGTGLDVTVRLYAEQLSQSFGKPVVARLTVGLPGVRTARLCNLIEEPGAALEMRRGVVTVPVKPMAHTNAPTVSTQRRMARA